MTQGKLDRILNRMPSFQYRYISTGLGTRVEGPVKSGLNEKSLVSPSGLSAGGLLHWLENRGKIPLELIEVQTGSYLGEDDIVRFEDQYGRAEPAPEKKP